MKAVRTAAFVIGAAALVATGVGAAVGAGILGGVAAGAAAGTAATFAGLSAAAFTTIGVALSAAAGALSLAAGAATPKGSVGGNATKFKIDKEAGIPIVFGRSYSGGNVVHRQYYNRPGDKMKNQLESWVTILSLGLVQSVGPLLIDKAPVAFDAGGQAIGTYRGNMWLDTQRGACPEGRALAGPFGAFPGWDASSRLSGLAADLWTLDFDSKGEKFPNGVPDRGRVIEGVLVYDPRLDSTYPGGSGPCRLGQPATYVYSECPGPHAITWAYGHYQNSVLVAGGGLSAAGIDMAPFVEWSNVCDANGWKVGGTVYATTDDAWDVLKMICQAGSGKPLPVGAQLSVTFSAPRVSIGTISSADISGDVDVPATVPRRTRRNTIIPSVRLESHGWEMVPLDPVSVPAYIAIDGGRRPREVSYPLVQNAPQGAQLAMYEMLNDRELDGIVVPAKVYALGYRPGDCITLQIPEANLIGREVVVGQRELDVGTNGVTLVCRSEDSSKHAFALGKTTTPPPTPDLSNPGIDRSAPDAADWLAIGTTLNANGVSVPAIVITSSVERIAAEEIVFDYRPRIAGASPDVNWTGASIEPSSVLRKELTSVTPNTAYDVGIRYRIRGAVSNRLIIENIVVGNAALPWTNVSDPDGTRPDPNATNGADPNSPFGPDRTVGETLATLAAIENIEFPTEAIDLLKLAAADRAAAERQMQRALDLLGEAILRVTGEAGHTREVLRDAGIVADPATGTVRIYALDMLAESTTARLAEVGLTIDAVKGSLTSKVERTQFDALSTDLGSVEQTLSSVGGASGLSVTARQARFAGGQGAEAGLRALLAGDETNRRQLVQIAEVRQEVFAKISDAQTAEAVARTLLNVQIGSVDARLATEILTRIAEGEAFARDIRALGVKDGDLAAEIAKVDEARIADGKATAKSLSDLSTSVGNADAAVKRVEEAVSAGDEANAEAIRQVTARLDDVGGVTIEEKFEATAERLGLVEGRYSVAIDTNGNLIGFQLIGSADGPGSFNLINTDLRMGTGRIIFNTGAYMQVQGIGFGASRDLVSWYGPTMAIDQCSRANAIDYKTTDGEAYFGGGLSAGTLKNGNASSDLAANAQIVVGPFGSNGGVIRIIANWSYDRNYTMSYPDSTNGRRDFDAACAAYGATSSDGIDYFGATTETVPSSSIQLERSFNGGGYAALGSPKQFATLNKTMTGLRPGNGDPGSGVFSESIGGGFTINDPVLDVADRTLRLSLTRGFQLSTGARQRLSIIATEE